MHWAGCEVGMGGFSAERKVEPVELALHLAGQWKGWGNSASSGMVKWDWLLLGFCPVPEGEARIKVWKISLTNECSKSGLSQLQC